MRWYRMMNREITAGCENESVESEEGIRFESEVESGFAERSQ